MSQGISLVVYPVKDLGRAKALYGKLLATEPYVDAPYYVGFRVGEQEIGLDPNGHAQGMTGPLGYVQVSDIKTSLKELLDAGAKTQQEVKNVGGGRLIATVKDRRRQPHRAHADGVSRRSEIPIAGRLGLTSKPAASRRSSWRTPGGPRRPGAPASGAP